MPFMRNCEKRNTVDTERPQMTIWCMHIACWNPKVTDTFTIRNTYSFSTAAMVVRTRLDVTFFVQ